MTEDIQYRKIRIVKRNTNNKYFLEAHCQYRQEWLRIQVDTQGKPTVQLGTTLTLEFDDFPSAYEYGVNIKMEQEYQCTEIKQT